MCAAADSHTLAQLPFCIEIKSLKLYFSGNNAEEEEEEEKLHQDEQEYEASLKERMLRAERLSLMIRFNHRGSLTSLDRGSRLELFRTNSSRRNSLTADLARSQGRKLSSPKIDLLKSTSDIGHLQKNSNPQLNSKISPPPPLQRHTTKVCLLYI